MRKRKKGRQLARTREQKKALLIGLATALIEKGKIKTSLARAKELRPFIEPHITRAKRGTLADQRQLLRFYQKPMVKKIVQEIAPQYKDRPGGYTRVVKLGPRSSDSAEMAIIELV
jgi:large subunit ribosomal protein L17